MAVETAELVPEVRGPDGKWLAGRSPNPGGVPKRIRQFQAILDEHGTEERTRKLFARLRKLAMGELEVVRYHPLTGEPYNAKLPPDAAFAKLYLDRVYGPVKDSDSGLADVLAEMPDEVLIHIRKRRDG